MKDVCQIQKGLVVWVLYFLLPTQHANGAALCLLPAGEKHAQERVA